MPKLQKILSFIIKFFLIWLVVQFFLHTLITYKFGWTGKLWSGIWLRKEIFVIGGLAAVGRLLIKEAKKQGREQLRTTLKRHQIFRFLVYFFAVCGISLLLALLVQRVGLSATILSAKYNLLGFMIFLIGVGLARFFPLGKGISLRYSKLLKSIIYWAFCRWMIILLLPSFLKLFGYSRDNFEGTLVDNPPAVYYDQNGKQLARNQFIFERPLSLWFFLVAFWPLFALSYLRKQSRKTQLWWTLAFGTIVFSTVSRAAIGVRILQTGVLLLLIYHKYAKKIILYGGLPALLLCIGGIVWFKDIFVRADSDAGHAKLLTEGFWIGMKNPIAWWGAGYAGPASHHLCLEVNENPRCQLIKTINQKHSMSTPGFNPENQYIQIFMEYGVLGLIPRLLCFGRLLWTSLKLIPLYIAEVKKGKNADSRHLTQLTTMIAFGIGLAGLALEGLVLHSFVDRMIVYPMMLLWGLNYGHIYPLQTEAWKTKNI